MVGGAEGRVVVYCPGQSVGERLQRIVQQPDEGRVCGPGSFRFVAGGEGFGRGIPAVLESGEVAQRDRVQNAGRIRRRTWAGLRYAPSAPSSITKPTDSHKHWYIKRGQATNALEVVNADGIPLFQMIRKTPTNIIVNGIFPMPRGGIIVAGPKGMIANANQSDVDGLQLKPIFKYPSWKYPGQYAD